MDLKDWVLTLVVLMIPCVGIVMYFVWAFGDKGISTAGTSAGHSVGYIWSTVGYLSGIFPAVWIGFDADGDILLNCFL